MKRCVIIGGADIGNYERIRRYLTEEDFYIFCDSGLRHRRGLKVEPNMIVGDFDSYPNPKLNIETIVLPCEKDDTDTMFAVKEGLSRGFREFLLVGVIGARFDHTMGNVSILLYLAKAGKHGIILDDYSEMELIEDRAVVEDTVAYFSLLNISGTAKGITIKNCKFPLEQAEISCDYQYGISNEVLPGKAAEITVQTGSLLLVKIAQ